MKERVGREIVVGTMLSEVATPNIARVLRAAGFEFIIVDCEHGPFSFPQLAALAAVCNCCGLPMIVRLPGIEREYILKCLDLGADGLLFPMLNSAGSMRRAVDFGKYQPLGKRGISVTRAHSEYAPGPLDRYLERANSRTMLFAQIETTEGVVNAEEIARVEGLDGLFVGPNDLAADMGSLGRFDTPDFAAALRTVVNACQAAGKPSGCISSSAPFLKNCMELGMTIFGCNSEVGMIIKMGQQIVKDLKREGLDERHGN